MSAPDFEERLEKASTFQELTDLGKAMEKAVQEDRRTRPQMTKVTAQLMHSSCKEARLSALVTALSLLSDPEQANVDILWASYEQALANSDDVGLDALRFLPNFIECADVLMRVATRMSLRRFNTEASEHLTQAMLALNSGVFSKK